MVLPAETNISQTSNDVATKSLSMSPLMKLESHSLTTEHLIQPLLPLQPSFNAESETSANSWCANCHTRNTPLWRRNASGEQLCNACGLFLRVNGKQRPVTLQKGPPASRAGHRRKRPTIARPLDKMTDLNQHDLEAAAQSHCQNLLRLMPMPRRMSNPESHLNGSFKGSLLSPPAESPELRLAKMQRSPLLYHQTAPPPPLMANPISPKHSNELPLWKRSQEISNDSAVPLSGSSTSTQATPTPPAPLVDMHPTLGTPVLHRLAAQASETSRTGSDAAAVSASAAPPNDGIPFSGENNGISASAAETAAATTLLAAAAESEEFRLARGGCPRCAERLLELQASQARQLETLAANIHYQIMVIASSLSREQQSTAWLMQQHAGDPGDK